MSGPCAENVEKLRAAIARDPSRRAQRVEDGPSMPPDLRLPDTLDAIRKAYLHGHHYAA